MSSSSITISTRSGFMEPAPWKASPPLARGRQGITRPGGRFAGGFESSLMGDSGGGGPLSGAVGAVRGAVRPEALDAGLEIDSWGPTELLARGPRVVAKALRRAAQAVTAERQPPPREPARDLAAPGERHDEGGRDVGRTKRDDAFAGQELEVRALRRVAVDDVVDRARAAALRGEHERLARVLDVRQRQQGAGRADDQTPTPAARNGEMETRDEGGQAAAVEQPRPDDDDRERAPRRERLHPA